MASCSKCGYDNLSAALTCNLCGIVLRKQAAALKGPAATEQPAPVVRIDAGQLRQEAHEHFMRGDAVAAVTLFDHWLLLAPTDRTAAVERALALSDLQRHSEGLTGLASVLAVEPDHVEALDGRSLVYARLERYDEALADCDRVLQLEPNRATTWRQRSALLTKKGDARGAMESAARATVCDPDDARGWLLRGLAEAKGSSAGEGARASLERAIALAGEQSPEIVRLAQQQLQSLAARASLFAIADARASGDPTQLALALVAAGSTSGPLAPPGQVDVSAGEKAARRAAILANQRNLTGALAEYDRAVAADPTSFDAQLGRAKVALDLRRGDAALTALNAAVTLRSTDATAWRLRGNCLDGLRDHANALASYEASLQHDGRNPLTLSDKAFCLLAMKRGDEAIACAEQAIALDERFALGRFAKALAEDSLGRAEDAMRSYRQFLAFAPPAMTSHAKHARERIAVHCIG